MAWQKASRHVVLLSASLFLVVGCAGHDEVVTQDDSADYHSARALPPLKKPAKRSITKRAQQQSGNDSSQRLDREPNIQTSQVSVGGTLVEKDSGSENFQSVGAESEPVISQVESPAANSITASKVVEMEVGLVRLLIETKSIDVAWAQLNADLRASDITVHFRNRTAGKFSIGCGDQVAPSEPVKKSGWSIFKSKPQASEYCTLQIAENKAGILVSALNTDGGEFSASAARTLFSRLLNN